MPNSIIHWLDLSNTRMLSTLTKFEMSYYKTCALYLLWWKSFIQPRKTGINISIYKKLNPDKGISAIFSGNKGNHSLSGKSTAKDPDAMEIDTAKQTKGKSMETSTKQPKKKFCQIYAGKDLKNQAKMHNTNDCWDKPGNEGKCPAKTPPQSKLTSMVSTSRNNSGKIKSRQSPCKFASKKQ